MGERGEILYANQTLNGLLNRWMHPGLDRAFTPDAFAPYSPVVHAGTILAGLGFSVLGLLVRWRRQPAAAIDFTSLGSPALLEMSKMCRWPGLAVVTCSSAARPFLAST